MVEIPFSGVPKESLVVTLEGRQIQMRSRYNNLIGVWSLDLLEVVEDTTVPLVYGVAIVLGIDLLAPYALELGGLFARANERPSDDAKRGELGRRVLLIYYTPEEMAGL